MSTTPEAGSTTQFVSNALEELRQAKTPEARSSALQKILWRIKKRLELITSKTIKRDVPEVWTQDIIDGATDRLVKFVSTDDNERHWGNLNNLNHLMSLAFNHMRWYLLDVLRARGGHAPFEVWVEARLSADNRRSQPDDPAETVVDKLSREAIMIEFWEAFEKFAKEDPRAADILEKSVVGGLPVAELATLYDVPESTMRDWLNKARMKFRRIYRKEWPFEN